MQSFAIARPAKQGGLVAALIRLPALTVPYDTNAAHKVHLIFIKQRSTFTN